MARPKKMTVEYFPHFVHSGKTLYILESSFGNDGYAFWFKLLELLGSTDYHVFDCGNPANWRFLLAKTHVNEETASEILKTLVELDAIDKELWQEKKIWCENLVRNLADVYKRRQVEIPKKESFRNRNHSVPDISATETTGEDSFCVVSEAETTQSKVKESKGKYSKNKTSSSRQKSDEATKIPYDEIVDLYHSICKSLPRIRALTEARKAQIRARWNENPDFEFWREFFERVENSDFLTGKVDRHDERKPFIADLQWITKQENQLKILEGKYDNREEVIDADKRRIIENIRRLKRLQDAERAGGSDRSDETE